MVGGIDIDFVKIYYKTPIVYLIFKNGVELGVPEIRELTAYAEMVSRRKPYVIFSDACQDIRVTHEGRRIAARAETAPLHRGTAVLVKSHMIQLAITLFNKFDKPEYPYGVFMDKQQAINWLMKLPLY